MLSFIAHAADTLVNPNIPGSYPGSDPVSQIANFYQLSLLAAGLLAFGIIIYAAIQYTISAGSPSAQSDAKDQILQAFIGIFLLFAAYLILSTINPELTLLKLPELVGLKEPPAPRSGIGGAGPGDGSCTPIPSGSGSACSPENLKQVAEQNGCNWDPQVMSTICNAESGGGNVCSNTDICVNSKNGGSPLQFSCGLFQINMVSGSADPSLFPECYANGKPILTAYDNGGKQGSCLKDSGRGYCALRNCGLADGVSQAQYDTCAAALNDPVRNLKNACKLYKSQGLCGGWGYSAHKCGLGGC